jgi:hypothetical protein
MSTNGDNAPAIKADLEVLRSELIGTLKSEMAAGFAAGLQGLREYFDQRMGEMEARLQRAFAEDQ